MTPESPEARYAMLRTALEMFHTPPADLDEAQSVQLKQRVNRELAIAQKLLQGSGGQITIPDATIEAAYRALVEGFANEEAFDETLSYNGLDRDSLREALRFDLRVEAALEQLLKEKGAVSEEEAESFYRQNLERFTLPETRTVSHILITINEEFPENRREEVVRRIEALREECAGEGALLKALAQRHSECPSAMQEGVIGRVKRGQLYPQLDEVLFAMAEGEVSGVIESEIGLHLLHCESIHPSEILPFDQVKEKIIAHLEKGKRAALLKEQLKP